MYRTLIALCFVLFGVGFFVGSWLSFDWRRESLERQAWPQVSGEVESSSLEYKAGVGVAAGHYYMTVIGWTLPDGRHFTRVDRQDFSDAVGSRVTLRYNPKNPASSELVWATDGGLLPLVLMIVFAVLGVLFLALAVALQLDPWLERRKQVGAAKA